MSGILPNFRNITSLVGALYPTFIVCFLVFASAFNMRILPSIVYLSGISVTVFLCYLIARVGVLEERSPNAPITCDLFGNHRYKGPSASAAITWFTFAYLLWPMLPLFNLKAVPPNPAIIALTAALALVNNIFQFRNECSSILGIIGGIIIGLVLGSVWYMLWAFSKQRDLLFNNDLVSNNAVCTRPSKQTFKCQVWKGGELISESTG